LGFHIEGRQTEVLEYRGVHGAARVKVTGGWRKLCNEILHNHNVIRIQVKTMRQEGQGTGMRQKQNVYAVLVRKLEGMRSCGRTMDRQQDNMKTDLEGRGQGL
jgi:hypothetical protein